VAEINQNSEIFVEGQLIGKLVGFCFKKDKSASNEESKALRATAHAVLGPQYQLKSEKLYNSSDEEFSFNEFGQIFWRAAAVGELTAGLDILSPKIVPLVDGEAGIEITESIKRRLDHFVNRTIEKHFEPLLRMRSDEALVGISKGVAYRIVEALGLISRNEISADIKVLEQQDRALLRKHGLRFGQFTIFHYLMLKPAPTKLRLLLWSLFFNTNYAVPPPAGLVTVPKVELAPPDYYLRAGYKLVGDRALRVDMLERLADLIRTKDVWNGFEADVDMLSITGLTLEQFAEVLRSLGYMAQKGKRKKALTSINISDQPPKIETTGIDFSNEKKEEVEIVKEVKGESEVEVEVYYVFKLQKKTQV
jgi:ATP-dependent RNA helicase SUPV3L1/SUV3